MNTSGYEAAKKTIEESLNKFGFPYFDLILHHYPMNDDIGTYIAIQKAYKEKKWRVIGLLILMKKNFLRYKIFYINSKLIYFVYKYLIG